MGNKRCADLCAQRRRNHEFESKVNDHYGSGGILEKIVDGLGLAGKDPASITVDDLAPIDASHTRGREGTLEVASLTELKPTDRVLDIGCGLRGTTRHLAKQYGCHVTGFDLTQE